MFFRLNCKRISIWMLLCAQIILLMTYFYIEFDKTTLSPSSDKIYFLQNKKVDKRAVITYHTMRSKIHLQTVSTQEHFINFNSSLCYINGTDMHSMQKSKQGNWHCYCLPGWHGNDCGQPEVLWRALLINKKPPDIKGPRIFERRLIYFIRMDKFTENLVDIRLNDLENIVDLFILFENNNSNFTEKKLNDNFAKQHHKNILYMKGKLQNIWLNVKKHLQNVRKDDIILLSNTNEIPNKDALGFLKHYNHWPEPIHFRLRWTVYGFFWLHPNKTINSGAACTATYLKDKLNNNLELLMDNKTSSNLSFKGLILGDLNHSGGWYCDYCNDAELIAENLVYNHNNLINWEKYRSKIDRDYIENLIENGLYIDGKTELKRTHRYNDLEFAPKFVADHDWKYDFLVTNLYSKLDYYAR